MYMETLLETFPVFQDSYQPRSQAFPSCGGKTLVQAGHVTPRFLEITKIRVGGGEWYNMLIRRTVNTNKAVLYVCVDRIV